MGWEDAYDVAKSTGDWLTLSKITDTISVRIVSKPVQYLNFYSKKHNKSYRVDPNNIPPQIAKNVSKRFLTIVIDRSDGKVKYCELPMIVMRDLINFSIDPDYAFDVIPGYDVRITKDDSGEFVKYSVLPAKSETPITKEEQAIIDQMTPPEEKVDEKPWLPVVGAQEKAVEEVFNNNEIPNEEPIDIEDVPFN